MSATVSWTSSGCTGQSRTVVLVLRSVLSVIRWANVLKISTLSQLVDVVRGVTNPRVVQVVICLVQTVVDRLVRVVQLTVVRRLLEENARSVLRVASAVGVKFVLHIDSCYHPTKDQKKNCREFHPE